MKRDSIPPRTLVREEIRFAGSFAPNGAGAIDLTARKGLGWTVVRTSAGLFTITFSDSFSALQSANATVQLAVPADLVPQIGVVSLAAKTVQILLMTGAVATDLAAAAGNRVNFEIVFRNSAAKPLYGP